MEFACPHCSRPIISRRNVLCSFCGLRLPDKLLFQGEEKKRIESDLAEAKKRLKKVGENYPDRDTSGPDPMDFS